MNISHFKYRKCSEIYAFQFKIKVDTFFILTPSIIYYKILQINWKDFLQF